MLMQAQGCSQSPDDMPTSAVAAADLQDASLVSPAENFIAHVGRPGRLDQISIQRRAAHNFQVI